MNKYFKGWYFKVQNANQIAAVIPAMHIDENGKKSASIQIIAENDVGCAWFPYEQFSCSGNRPHVKISDNLFCEQVLKLNVKTDTITADGNLQFGPLSPIRYDIMGPFCFMPFMECRHSVFSMTHTVNGNLNINGKKYMFANDYGYIEGDRGRSFPKIYVWTQCNFFDKFPNSIMLSVAEIPLGAIHFKGVIGVILWHGKEYRIATYLGAKVVNVGNRKLVIRQGRLNLTAELIKMQDKPLYAPVGGSMKRMIHESPSCTAYYCFEENGEKRFEFNTDRAAFEYEWNN